MGSHVSIDARWDVWSSLSIFQIIFSVLKLVPSWLGECLNSVLLERSRNVLWPITSPDFPSAWAWLDHDCIFIFGCTYPLYILKLTWSHSPHTFSPGVTDILQMQCIYAEYPLGKPGEEKLPLLSCRLSPHPVHKNTHMHYARAVSMMHCLLVSAWKHLSH